LRDDQCSLVSGLVSPHWGQRFSAVMAAAPGRVVADEQVWPSSSATSVTSANWVVQCTVTPSAPTRSRSACTRSMASRMPTSGPSMFVLSNPPIGLVEVAADVAVSLHAIKPSSRLQNAERVVTRIRDQRHVRHQPRPLEVLVQPRFGLLGHGGDLAHLGQRTNHQVEVARLRR
jgi:hypothetical protein